MKILHISFHKGCINDINYVLNKLNLDFENMFFFNELDKDAIHGPYHYYKLTKDNANMYWNKYKDFFNKFDCIITSDTAPLSRIFLQNNWNKKLIIWICNRFDYNVEGDQHYYNLIREAYNKQNVDIIGYTAFENIYCKIIRDVEVGNKVITPCGNISETYHKFVEKKELNDIIFVPPYHNDNKMMNLSDQLTNLGIKNFNGRYDGPMDLLNYKCVVHIPYAWSNLAFFESFHLGVVYFIPSTNLLFELSTNHNFWFQNKNLIYKNIKLSEWYNPDYDNLLIKFDSWEDLKNKINSLNYEEHKLKLKEFGKKHEENILNSWKLLLN